MLDSRPFVVAQLVANSEYKVLVYECDSLSETHVQLQELHVRTQAPSKYYIISFTYSYKTKSLHPGSFSH